MLTLHGRVLGKNKSGSRCCVVEVLPRGWDYALAFKRKQNQNNSFSASLLTVFVSFCLTVLEEEPSCNVGGCELAVNQTTDGVLHSRCPQPRDYLFNPLARGDRRFLRLTPLLIRCICPESSALLSSASRRAYR